MENDRDDDLCCRHRFPWNRRYPWNSDHGCFRRNLNLDDYNDMSLNTLDSKANKESAEK